MKYSRFLWSIQILDLYLTSSNKYLQFSKSLITTNISLSWTSLFLSVLFKDLDKYTTSLHYLSSYFINNTLPIA